MIRLWYLRFMANCYDRQREGLLAELAGTQYMLKVNEEKQRKVTARLAMAETERRYRVAR